MSIFRMFIGLPAAALITLGLFAFMAAMIQQPPPPGTTKTIDIPSFVFEPEPEARTIEIHQTPTPTAPAPIELDPFRPTGDLTEHRFDPKPGPISPTAGDYSGGMTMAGPTIKTPPAYPSSCQSKGAEGEVLVEFDVTPEGNVINARVISSADKCFNRTVLRSIAKWKYPPDIKNNRAVARRGLVEKFVFTLTE